MNTNNLAVLKRELGDFIDHRGAFTMLNDYDVAMDGLRRIIEKMGSELSDEMAEISTRIFNIADQGLFLTEVSLWKIFYIAKAILQAIDSENQISFALNIRALVEHLATLVTVQDELQKLYVGLQGQGSKTKIVEKITKTEKFLHRAYYGKSPKATKKKDNQALHVNDCLEVFAKELPEIEEEYDFLCEYVHPNYGSNALVSSGRLAGGKLNPPDMFESDSLIRIANSALICMRFLQTKVIVYRSRVLLFQDLFERFISPKAKLSNVFSERSPKASTDGKTKDSAIYFSTARTHLEAMSMSKKYLEGKGCTIEGSQVGGIEDGYFYDLYSTNLGDVWFKFRMPKMPG